MFHYHAYGHSLLSDLPFAELDQVEPGCRLPSIRLEAAEVVAPCSSLRYECLWPSGARYFAAYGDGTRYVLRFPDVCDVDVDVDRRAVRISRLPPIAAETIRHILLDQVIPRLIAAAGRTVLHASAVETRVGTVAFLGEGGAGKSTLAAVFSAAGDALVSDDALVIEVAGGRAYARPGYPRLRLFPDAARQFFGRNDRGWLPNNAKKWCVRPPVVSNQASARGPSSP